MDCSALEQKISALWIHFVRIRDFCNDHIVVYTGDLSMTDFINKQGTDLHDPWSLAR